MWDHQYFCCSFEIYVYILSGMELHQDIVDTIINDQS